MSENHFDNRWIIPFRGQTPRVDPGAFIAPNATLIGDVEIGPNSGVWFGALLRGDVKPIRVGAGTNLQDGVIVHGTHNLSGTIIGDDVTVGHGAILHACTVQSHSFVGMRACVLDGVVIESGAMVAAGALVTPGRVVRSGQLWAGSPAKYVRDLTEEERVWYAQGAATLYRELCEEYRVMLSPERFDSREPIRPLERVGRLVAGQPSSKSILGL